MALRAELLRPAVPHLLVALLLAALRVAVAAVAVVADPLPSH